MHLTRVCIFPKLTKKTLLAFYMICGKMGEWDGHDLKELTWGVS